LGSLFVMEAWNREGVFYILLWLCILSYYTFYRVFGGRDEGGLDEEMTGIDVYVTQRNTNVLEYWRCDTGSCK